MTDRSGPEMPQEPADSLKAAAPPDAETRSISETSAPMLDVHAPHESIHTWKGFFIHIATIVIGLLIAVGLEQSVEYIHHRHQLQEARRELLIEVDDNLHLIELNIESTRKTSLALDADIAMLRAKQSSNSPVAMKLDYTWHPNDTQDGAWQAAKQSGALSLMPHEELRRYTRVYTVLAAIMDALPAFGARMEVAGAIARRVPDGDLPLREIEELMSATSEAQGRLALLIRLLKYAKSDLEDVRAS
jgi:hypothetical protein